MSMHDKIKEAFKKDRPLKSSWSQEYQPNIYSLDIFLRKAGYRLLDVIPQDVDGSTINELVLEPMKDSYLYPAISHAVEDHIFYIEVKRYGELPPSDVEGLIKGYQNALGVAHHLEEIDLSKLEVDATSNKKKEDIEEE